ncbi:hypothetical protein D3C76_1287880 [compost metagenome]
MVEYIEERFQCLMAFTTLGDVVQEGRRHRRVDAVQAQQASAYRRRTLRMGFIGFDGFQFTRRKPHARIGPKAHRIIRRVGGAAQRWMIGQRLFQQLTEAVEVGLGDPSVQRLQ